MGEINEKNIEKIENKKEEIEEQELNEPELTNIRKINELCNNFFIKNGVSKEIIGTYYQWAHNLIIYGDFLFF